MKIPRSDKKLLQAVVDCHNDSLVKAQQNNPVFFWLGKFLQTPAIQNRTSDQAILLDEFSSWLKEQNPDVHKDLFVKYNRYKVPSQFWELFCLSGEPAVLRALLDNNIIDKQIANPIGLTIAHLVGLSGSVPAMEEAAQNKLRMLAKNKDGLNLLHMAAISGNPVAMQKAVDLGIDPKSVSNRGTSIAHFAALSGDPAAIEKAVELGVDPLSVNKDGTTILHLAAQSGSVAAMQDAWLRGVYADSEDSDDRTIHFYAEKSGSQAAIDFAKQISPRVPSPSDQDWFITLLKRLHYKGGLGMCYGMSQMAVRAFLAGDMHKFNARLALLETYVNKPEQLEKDLAEALEAGKKGQLRPEMQDLLEIKEFFEGLQAFQQFQESDEYKNVDLVTLFTPDKLLENNGRIEKVLSFTTELNDSNLEEFLTTLKNTSINTSVPVSTTLGALMHAINISYDPKSNTWILVDANKLPPKEIPGNDVNLIKREVTKSLEAGIRNNKVAFALLSTFASTLEARIYVHNDNAKFENVRAFKTDLKNALARKKPLTLWQRTVNFCKKHPFLTAGLVCIGFAAICGVIALTVATGGAGLAVLGGATVTCLALGGGLMGGEILHQKKLQDREKEKGNRESELANYFILETDGKKIRFGSAKSDTQTRAREKFVDYSQALQAAKLVEQDKKTLMGKLQQAMIEVEKSKGSAKDVALTKLDRIFEEVKTTIIVTPAEPTTSDTGKTKLTDLEIETIIAPDKTEKIAELDKLFCDLIKVLEDASQLSIYSESTKEEINKSKEEWELARIAIQEKGFGHVDVEKLDKVIAMTKERKFNIEKKLADVLADVVEKCIKHESTATIMMKEGGVNVEQQHKERQHKEQQALPRSAQTAVDHHRSDQKKSGFFWRRHPPFNKEPPIEGARRSIMSLMTRRRRLK